MTTRWLCLLQPKKVQLFVLIFVIFSSCFQVLYYRTIIDQQENLYNIPEAESMKETTHLDALSFTGPKALMAKITHKSATRTPTYTVVVVNCRGNLSWLDDVPPQDWRIVVYEKCHSTPSTRHFSIMTALRADRDECNGYLDYLHDYYDNLTEVTVFMQDDGLVPYAKYSNTFGHTNFTKFEEIVAATKRFIRVNNDDTSSATHPPPAWITFGILTMNTTFGNWTTLPHGPAQKILWPYLRQPKTLEVPPTHISFKPAAHFAVHRSAIQYRPRATYWALLQQVRYARDFELKQGNNNNIPGSINFDISNYWPNSRGVCYGLEAVWHILFGQPPLLPKSTMVYDILKEEGYFGNLHSFTAGHLLQQQFSSPQFTQWASELVKVNKVAQERRKKKQKQ